MKNSITLEIEEDFKVLLGERCVVLKHAFDRAVGTVNEKLGQINAGKPITIVAYNYPAGAIPEDGCGGRTIHSGLIELYINPERMAENACYSYICHELSHAKRWSEFPDYDSTLAGALVLEGLAVAFEDEINHNKTFMLKTLNKAKDGPRLLEYLRHDLWLNDYDFSKNYVELFFEGNPAKNLPRWTGYEVGYFVVKRLMEKTKKPASALIGEKVTSFF